MEEQKHSDHSTDVIQEMKQELDRLRRENEELRRRLIHVWGET